MLGMTTFKAPALKFAQMNALNNLNGTFLYTFDYTGKSSRYIDPQSLFKVRNYFFIIVFSLLGNRFGYGEDTSHYPFSGGVSHSDELHYLFPYPPDDVNLNEEDTKIAQLMVDLWTSFAISGIPGTSQRQDETSGVEWEPFSGYSSNFSQTSTEFTLLQYELKAFSFNFRSVGFIFTY